MPNEKGAHFKLWPTVYIVICCPIFNVGITEQVSTYKTLYFTADVKVRKKNNICM